MEKPKDHLYVLLAVGMYEGQWRPFETEISGLKLELADRLSRRGKSRFELADCEVKSNWVRIPGEREKRQQETALDGLKVWPDRSPGWQRRRGIRSNEKPSVWRVSEWKGDEATILRSQSRRAE